MRTRPLFSVVAVEIETKAERFLARDKTRREAKAIIKMAVLRRGVAVEFYKIVPAKERNAA